MLKPRRAIYAQLKNRYAEESRPILIFFSATWCDACQEQKPVVAAVAPQIEGRVRLIPIDIDEDPELKQAAGIKAVPAFVFVNAGKNDGALVIGQKSDEKLKQFIDAALALE